METSLSNIEELINLITIIEIKNLRDAYISIKNIFTENSDCLLSSHIFFMPIIFHATFLAYYADV